jgi:hypothetical protein
MKRILITGAAGKIGSVLQFFAPAGARYGRVPVPASSSEPREIHTVMVPPPMGGGNVYTLATGARSTQRDTRRSKAERRSGVRRGGRRDRWCNVRIKS